MKEFGPYELIKEIGAGGMAEVWLGREKDSQTLYAIKRIHPHLAREKKFIEMFIDEAKIGSSFDHPNIAKIVDVGEIDEIPFITMEYIDGKDLAYVLDVIESSDYEIPIGVALKITIQILDALGYAHRYKVDGVSQNIIHRDISPHNMLVSKEGRVCLLDFGVAKALDRSAKTETGVVKGKLSYMSPEQVQQEPMDHRADLFSMGVVLYELITQSTPFGRELKAVNGIINNEAPDPTILRHDIPRPLAVLVLKSLEKDPNARFQSAFEMASALGDILTNFYPETKQKDIEAMFAATLQHYKEATVEHHVELEEEPLESVLEEENEPSKKSGFLIPIALVIFISLLGFASYQTLFSQTESIPKAVEAPNKVVEIEEEVVVEEKVEIPLFTKLLTAFSKEPILMSELDDEEIKKVLDYKFGQKNEDYLIENKVSLFTNVFREEDSVEDKKKFIDPGDPKARFNLRTTLKERKARRRAEKERRKVRRDYLEKLRLAEKKQKKRKQKRKKKLIDKVIPGGF